jgi:hypothetical protein
MTHDYSPSSQCELVSKDASIGSRPTRTSMQSVALQLKSNGGRVNRAFTQTEEA